MERVIAYVDGYNLYYSLRSEGWKWFYWLNIQALVQRMLKPHQTLAATKYFTTVIKQPEDKRRRQAAYLDALQTLPAFHLYYGQFLSETVTCRKCGHTYTTYHEKMTDVNISVELMADAFQNQFDVALLLSADSDLVGPVETVRRFFSAKRVVAVFPPSRSSVALKSAANAVTYLGRSTLLNSVFPNAVTKPDGTILRRPAKWR